jgi:hypothetical protein
MGCFPLTSTIFFFPLPGLFIYSTSATSLSPLASFYPSTVLACCDCDLANSCGSDEVITWIMKAGLAFIYRCCDSLQAIVHLDLMSV